MTDSYQAIYDAVRSRISGGNVEQAIRDSIGSNFDISHAREMVKDELIHAAYEMQRPSVLFRPKLTQPQWSDGEVDREDMKWQAYYQPKDSPWCISAFGATPDAAMRAFDEAWRKP